MKRTLLIVDDEEFIRFGIRAMLEREFPDCYEFYFAEDGEEALEILGSNVIDIMMTDIRMPIMDGITLIGLLQQLERRPAVVIVSGHDDFEYAKQAIRYEVRDYLLKPIVRGELHQTFSRLEHELKRDEEIHGMLSAAVLKEEAYRQSEIQYVLLNDGMSGQEVAARLEKSGITELQAGYCLGLVQAVELEGRAEGNVLLQTRIDEFLRSTGRPGEWRFTDKENRSLVLFRDERRLNELLDHLGQGRLKSCQMGVSDWTGDAEQFRQAYLQALKALRYFFLKSAPGIIRYSQIKDKPLGGEIPKEVIIKIGNMLGTGREQEIKSLLVKVLEYPKILRYDISYMEEISKAINELIFDRVFFVYGEEAVEILKLYRQIGSLYQSPNFHSYYHGVENLLERLNDFIREVKSTHLNQKEMRAAMDFIDSNYERMDLNLAMVSNHVSFNYSYFSSVFKEYTGMSFIQYIKKLRLTKAKELLDHSLLKIYEISAKVGFENPKHFNKVFREAEGISPMEYRTRTVIVQAPSVVNKEENID
ncbi:response regulator [Cohnella abietis]|uniref:AraC family transcriptional regulator n=1 Tax=Cohnella abietis TaxID=2507935 RepID=A0A3T1D491_9BACL|nr:response regulator [Cohnella abietis]BBI32795.1 AraC family transcriptional regulator [Cohnella abietis]